ncbi:MAG: HAD family phosphatase [Acidimicrobiia bacterium]|nr:HAD family phosphatase [Acidimicrobiia bacterium]
MNGVVFDFDGVLADSESLSWNAWRTVLRRCGVDMSDADLVACLGTNSRDTYAHFAGRGALPPYEEVLGAVDEFRRCRYPSELQGFADAINAAQALSMVGVPLAVATSSSRQNLDLKLDVLGLGRYFDATVAGDEVPRGKPAPDLYFEAVRRAGIDAGTSVAVEDTRVGADAAAAAGLRVVIVNRMGLNTGMHPTVSEVDPDLLLLWLGRT